MANPVFYVYDPSLGTNTYFRIVERSTGKIWSTTTSALQALTLWTDSDLAATNSTLVGGTDGARKVNIPATLPSGEYDLLFYDNASATSADVLLLRKPFYYDKSRQYFTY